MKLKIESYKLLLFTVTVSYSTSISISSLISSFLLLSALLLTEAERAIGWSPDQTRPDQPVTSQALLTIKWIKKTEVDMYTLTVSSQSTIRRYLTMSTISLHLHLHLYRQKSFSHDAQLTHHTIWPDLSWPILTYPTAVDTVHNRSVRWINTL